MLPIPATYVVGQDGVIALAFVDPDYRNRLEPAEILRALQGDSLIADLRLASAWRGCAVFPKGGRQSTERGAGFCVRECRKKHDFGRWKRRKS